MYLAASREHPAAPVVRRQQRDFGFIAASLQDLDETQGRLFVAVAGFFVRYRAPELQPLVDDDVVDACGALAATLETAARGVIYEHRPASLGAQRVASELKTILEQGARGGSAFERNAAVVLRRIEQAARGAQEADPANRRAFVDLLARVIRPADDREPEASTPDTPRLIVP